MSGPINDKPIYKEYREAVARLDAARSEALEERKGVEATGDANAGAQSLEKLRVAVDAFKEFRSKLSPADLFVIEYNVEVLASNRVSLVIPANVSPFDVANRAQDVCVEAFGAQAFSDELLEVLAAEAMGRLTESYSRKIDIDGYVQGTAGRSIEQQDAILQRRGLTPPNLLELGLAHAAYTLATGEDLFQGKKVRADWLALFVTPSGLRFDTPGMYSDKPRFASSARFSKSLEEFE